MLADVLVSCIHDWCVWMFLPYMVKTSCVGRKFHITIQERILLYHCIHTRIEEKVRLWRIGPSRGGRGRGRG